MLPTELKHCSPRVCAFNEAAQEEQWDEELALLQEAKCQAAVRAVSYQQGLRRYHSRHIRRRTLEVGDLVLSRILSREGLHKLSPMWEGPYRVTSVAQPSAEGLETKDGISVKNSWNIEHLRKIYL